MSEGPAITNISSRDSEVQNIFGESNIRLWLSLMPHAIPFIALPSIFFLFRWYGGTALGWLVTAISWRYFRLAVNLYSTLRYTRNIPTMSATAPQTHEISHRDVTIIIPTVSDSDNAELQECLATCIANKPRRIILSADTRQRACDLETLVRNMKNDNVEISIQQSGVTSKRKQMVDAINGVETCITMGMDDHVFLPDIFLQYTLSVFDDPNVALCGTIKNVRRKKLVADSFFGRYWERFCNFLGAVYLQRHNFEIKATHAMDGGLFVVSGRAMLVRTDILKDKDFQEAFLNEYIFNIFGPVDPGDDNTITRKVLSMGKDIVISKIPVETTLGEAEKYFDQILRWRRTTIINLDILLYLILWQRWKWTVWTTYIPSLFNLAFFWDFGMLYALTQTQLYANHTYPRLLLFFLGAFIYWSKLIKLLPHFEKYPVDFFLYFFPIPAYHLFAYFHSFVTIWAYITFWDCSWAGRNLDPPSRESMNKNFDKPVRKSNGIRTKALCATDRS